MRRLLAICAVAVAILAAVAVARNNTPIAHAAASNPGNLLLIATERAQSGCPLGPAFTFCDQVPATQGPASRFVVEALVAVNGVSVSFAAVPGLASHFAAGDFTITNNTCTGNLAATQECAIDVAFSPTASGLRAAALTATDAAGDALAINIEGTGKNLTMASPAALTFPALPVILGPSGNEFSFASTSVGGTSLATTVTLTAGAAGATGVNSTFAVIPGLESGFAASDFTIESTTCTGALAPNGSCTVSVSFTPTTVGFRSAALTATDSDGDSTTIYLAGNTRSDIASPLPTPPTNQAPCAQVNWFGFCNEPSGGTSTANTYTLVNDSGVQITGLTIPKGSTTPNSSTLSDFTVKSTTCTSALAASATCQISVAFTPQGTGLRQGAIVVTDGLGFVAAVNLAGAGDDYNLQLASSQSLELTVAAGSTATFSAQVIPDSVFGLNGERVTFVCPTNLPANTSCAITPCPATITAGTPASFQIAFVTSSAATVAPVPTAGCSGYGPSLNAASPGAPGPGLRPPGVPGTGTRAAVFPVVATLALLALFFGRMDLLAGRARKRVALMSACAGLAVVVIVAGCGGHGAAKPTSATPASTTTMQLQGNALDASGNPLNTSRSLHVILNVTAK